MDRWVERPPNPCHRTQKDEPKEGQPYFLESFHYIDVVRGPQGPQAAHRTKQLVHAASWIKSMCDTPGSPFVCLTVEEAAEYEAKAQDRDDLLIELDEARAQIAELEQHVSPSTLAEAVVVELEKRRKGRKTPLDAA